MVTTLKKANTQKCYGIEKFEPVNNVDYCEDFLRFLGVELGLSRWVRGGARVTG